MLFLKLSIHAYHLAHSTGSLQLVLGFQRHLQGEFLFFYVVRQF